MDREGLNDFDWKYLLLQDIRYHGLVSNNLVDHHHWDARRHAEKDIKIQGREHHEVWKMKVTHVVKIRAVVVVNRAKLSVFFRFALYG